MLSEENFKRVIIEGRTYLTPIKENETYGYAIGIKPTQPENNKYCNTEVLIRVQTAARENIKTENDTIERILSYNKVTVLFLKRNRGLRTIESSYLPLKPLKQIKEETWIHLCIKKEPKNPKKATIYLSAPFVREYKQWAHTSN